MALSDFSAVAIPLVLFCSGCLRAALYFFSNEAHFARLGGHQTYGVVVSCDYSETHKAKNSEDETYDIYRLNVDFTHGESSYSISETVNNPVNSRAPFAPGEHIAVSFPRGMPEKAETGQLRNLWLEHNIVALVVAVVLTFPFLPGVQLAS